MMEELTLCLSSELMAVHNREVYILYIVLLCERNIIIIVLLLES